MLWYSLEAPHWATNDYHNMFSLRNKKSIILINLLICRYAIANLCVFMPPTLKLDGHITFGLFVCLFLVLQILRMVKNGYRQDLEILCVK